MAACPLLSGARGGSVAGRSPARRGHGPWAARCRGGVVPAYVHAVHTARGDHHRGAGRNPRHGHHGAVRLDPEHCSAHPAAVAGRGGHCPRSRHGSGCPRLGRPAGTGIRSRIHGSLAADPAGARQGTEVEADQAPGHHIGILAVRRTAGHRGRVWHHDHLARRPAGRRVPAFNPAGGHLRRRQPSVHTRRERPERGGDGHRPPGQPGWPRWEGCATRSRCSRPGRGG